MASSGFAIWEDVTTYDLVWKRASEEEEENRGPGELDNDGTYILELYFPFSGPGPESPDFLGELNPSFPV